MPSKNEFSMLQSNIIWMNYFVLIIPMVRECLQYQRKSVLQKDLNKMLPLLELLELCTSFCRLPRGYQEVTQSSVIFRVLFDKR